MTQSDSSKQPQRENSQIMPLPPTSIEMATGRLHFENCSVGPDFVIWDSVHTFDNIRHKL